MSPPPVDTIQSPRPKSPHMNNEEPIELAHFPGARPPKPTEIPKIERDDFPAPPFPYTDPERRRRWSGSSSKGEEEEEATEEPAQEDPQLKKEEQELSKIATGIGKVSAGDPVVWPFLVSGLPWAVGKKKARLSPFAILTRTKESCSLLPASCIASPPVVSPSTLVSAQCLFSRAACLARGILCRERPPCRSDLHSARWPSLPCVRLLKDLV